MSAQAASPALVEAGLLSSTLSYLRRWHGQQLKPAGEEEEGGEGGDDWDDWDEEEGGGGGAGAKDEGQAGTSGEAGGGAVECMSEFLRALMRQQQQRGAGGEAWLAGLGAEDRALCGALLAAREEEEEEEA